MRRLLAITALIFLTETAFCQFNFNRGFQSGYKKGYCHDQGVGCIPPVPPVTPILTVGENDSYQDGYNRGFEMGLFANKGLSSTTRQRYKTSSAEPIDYIQRIDLNDIIAKARVLKEAKNKAITLLEEENYQTAINIGEAALKVSPRDAEFMMICASGYLELENWQRGVSYLKMVVKYAKDSETIKNSNDIIREITSGEYQRLRELERNSPSNQPENSSEPNKATIHMDDLKTALSSKDYKKALQISNYIVALNNSWSAYAQRGSIQLFLGNYSESVADYSKAIALDGNARLYLERASAKERLEDYYGALNDYDKLIEVVKPSDNIDMALVFNNKAYNLVNLNRLTEALPFVNKALELNQQKWYIWDTRGEVNFKLGNFKNCIEDMTKAIDINPDGNSYYFRGLAKIKMGNKINGCQDLSKSGELGISKAYNEIKQYCK